VFVVADGMGGHAAGEVASELAVGEFRSLGGIGELSITTVSSAIERANEAIHAAGSKKEARGMGTTLVGMALVIDREQELWCAFNVGDSRLYRLFDGILECVTTDHSEVQELVDEGTMSLEDARHYSRRNVITRALGAESSVEPDFWLLPPVPGERFLLCSDGLNSEVDDEQIQVILEAETEPSAAATRLVERAVSAGGRDNVTVVVIDVVAATGASDSDTADRLVSPFTRRDLEQR
jgi:PPM family protein phosphatase